jgi:GTP cyclohydrolase I
MAKATRDFLEAAGMDPGAPDLADTPDRVAATWRESFLDGYAQDPARILSATFPDPGGHPVVLGDLAFHSLCPHHLLPFSGAAFVGYVPRDRAVGFSQVVRLIDCFAHRLTLQEHIAREVADALVAYLGAHAAVCRLHAEQTCVTLRGVRRVGTTVWTEASAGDPAWLERLCRLMDAGPTRGAR